MLFFFFFSSRRRHTRSTRDWSSDVCSSDLTAEGDPVAKDAALIAAAQRVEHYEIAAYGTARTLADELGIEDAKELLDQTRDEEANADKLLTKIATGGMFRSGINQE